MSDSTEGVAQNMEQGRGIVEKTPFRTVGANPNDLKTGGHQEDSRGRGRPPVDKTWSQVGRDADKESGQ